MAFLSVFAFFAAFMAVIIAILFILFAAGLTLLLLGAVKLHKGRQAGRRWPVVCIVIGSILLLLALAGAVLMLFPWG